VARVDMRKLGVVFKREYLERVRSKWFLIGTLLGPVFFALITVVPVLISAKTKGTPDIANVAILDATGSGVGERIAAGLRTRYPASSAPRVSHIAPADLGREEDRATLLVQRKELLGYLVLDSGTVAGRSARYAGRNGGSIGDTEQLGRVVREQVMAERLTSAGLDANRVAALTATRLELGTEKIGDHGREKGSGMATAIFGYVIAYLLFMMIMLYGQMILRGVMEEKTTRVAEVVVSSVNPDTLLAGKITGVGMVAITQVVAWFAISAVLYLQLLPGLMVKFGADASSGRTGSAAALASALPSLSLSTGLALLAFFVLGFIFYSSLFAAVGAMVNNQEDVQQAQMPVTMLLISSIIFMPMVATNPGSGLARTMSLIPFSAPILMPLRMTLVPVPWYEVAGAIVGIALACLVAIWLSARIYRVGLLMYGKRPSVAELARWVRYAG
jgi:ABC-2 type transport system permease protein